MAASKFIKQVLGIFTEEAPGTAGGGGDAFKIPALDANGQLTTAMMPSGIGADTLTVLASEALTAGQLVNVYNNASTLNVRKADASAASAGKIANGFVLANVSSAANATVYRIGQNNQVTGLTPGPLFLSDSTPGAVTSTAPTTSGHTVQKVGDAATATLMDFEPGPPIVLA